MGRKRPMPPTKTISYTNTQAVQDKLLTELEVNPKYSLNVDPEGKYNMSDEKKSFVSAYIDFRSVAMCAEVLQISMEKAKELFNDYAVQSEIRRINLALYQRRFATKLLNLDQIGGYLSSLLTDQYVPLVDQLPQSKKLEVVDTLIRLNQLKLEGMNDPAVIIEKDISTQLKDLSIDTIKSLLTESENKNKKVELIANLDKDNVLSLEEKSYLESLSTKELLDLVNETTTKHKGETNE